MERGTQGKKNKRQSVHTRHPSIHQSWPWQETSSAAGTFFGWASLLPARRRTAGADAIAHLLLCTPPPLPVRGISNIHCDQLGHERVLITTAKDAEPSPSQAVGAAATRCRQTLPLSLCGIGTTQQAARVSLILTARSYKRAHASASSIVRRRAQLRTTTPLSFLPATAERAGGGRGKRAPVVLSVHYCLLPFAHSEQIDRPGTHKRLSRKKHKAFLGVL